jgi:Tol biopolymer transport system component
MPAMGGDAVQVTAIQGRGASESPDGRDLYFHAVSIEAPLWRQPLSGGEPVKVLEGIVWYNYCLAGGGAYYIDRHEGETRLRYLDLGSGRSTTVAGNLGEVSAGLTVSPDGRTILFTRVDSSADDLVLVEDFR